MYVFGEDKEQTRGGVVPCRMSSMYKIRKCEEIQHVLVNVTHIQNKKMADGRRGKS